MNKSGCAIDLGTSTIVVHIFRHGHITKLQIKNVEDEYLWCIYYNNNIYFGKEALNERRKNPEFLIKNIKPLIGRSFDDDYVQQVKKTVPYKIERGEDGLTMIEVVKNGKQVLKS